MDVFNDVACLVSDDCTKCCMVMNFLDLYWSCIHEEEIEYCLITTGGIHNIIQSILSRFRGDYRRGIDW
jgi:hypothetical protein